MNRHVNAIAGRLSLRAPQRRSLETLDRVTEILPPQAKVTDVQAALEVLRSEYPSVTDFERGFPSLCFALATGVGKTRLMGAFISYLHLAHGINNFFVLAPNLTIYNKLIADFTPNTPKYVFKGIAEFATNPPTIITGDNYEGQAGTLFDLVLRCKINIFNISKINSEVRGGKSPRIKRLSEYIGQSYFDYLAELPDLVLIMDESHRYRASAGVRAINDLKPVLGLELTATPYVETSSGAIPFKNVIYDYPLALAMADGFVKEPAVATRKNFHAGGMTPSEIERLKLEDGIRLHESVKVELETYARQTGNPIVKPFLLVIARDTTHAGELIKLIQSDKFFAGRYKERVIQVDSSKTGAEEDEMVQRLLRVEHTDEPTEIVIHVNMLKEGWDVTNLYTIVPLRAANARILIEQSIGRGLRLPYGKRTGVLAVDTLNIVAHDKFQEIVDEANRPDSPIRLRQVVLDTAQLRSTPAAVVSQPNVEARLGLQPQGASSSTQLPAAAPAPVFTNPQEQAVAQLAYEAMRKLGGRPQVAPSASYLQQPAVQTKVIEEVTAQYGGGQLTLDGVAPAVDIAAVVARTAELVVQGTIDIPRILVVPRGEVRSGYHPFALDLSSLRYQPITDDLWLQQLRTGQGAVVSLNRNGAQEARLEDYIVSALMDFDDISYDLHADLLYDLAAQSVRHFQVYLTDEQVRNVLRVYQKHIANLIHVQMQSAYWEDAVEYDVVVSQGFVELKQSAYSADRDEAPLDFRQSPADKSNMQRYLFGGFARCLYPVQKFQSDAERRLAVILDRDALKWFKPARGQFQIYYQDGAEQREYVPDFVAEDAEGVYMLEPKASDETDDKVVLAKQAAAQLWCARASRHAETYGGKRWRYALISHNVINESMALRWLVDQHAVR